MTIAYDGNWVDACSVGTAMIYAVVHKQRKQIASWTDRRIALHLANGIGLFPVLILAPGVFSKGLLGELLEASRVTLFIAGCFALVSMLDD